MSENGIKGRIKYFSVKENREIFLYKEDLIIPKGFIKGELPSKSAKTSKTMSKKKSYYNPSTKESIRIEGEPPEGFLRGRGEFNNVGSTGRSWYHLDRNEIYQKEKPIGWFYGKIHKHNFIYDNKHIFIGEYSDKIAKEKFCTTIVKATKEKPIGYNKTYRSRLSKEAKECIGMYVIKK